MEDGNVWAAVGDGVGGGEGGEDSENRLKIESLKTLGGVVERPLTSITVNDVK